MFETTTYVWKKRCRNGPLPERKTTKRLRFRWSTGTWVKLAPVKCASRSSQPVKTADLRGGSHGSDGLLPRWVPSGGSEDEAEDTSVQGTSHKNISHGKPEVRKSADEIRGYVSSKGRISTSNTCEPLKMPTPRHKALIGDY